MLTINGSQGEGGGQILRTALALSVCFGQPFRIVQIRAGRKRPGLQPQHLAAVSAAAAISHAEMEGAEKGSQELVFIPGKITGGEYFFDIGTAGSTSLVLQTVLPALIRADIQSKLVITGGTHNPFAPPFEFIKYAFLPLIKQMAVNVDVGLMQYGFAPSGGGRIEVRVEPIEKLKPISILERGVIQSCHAEVILSNLPEHIATRECNALRQQMSLNENDIRYIKIDNLRDPGNIVSLIVESKNISECFTTFGKKGLPAERVATIVAQNAKEYIDADIPIGKYLADQVLLYMALAGSGEVLTCQPSLHTLTNISVIEYFMGECIKLEQSEEKKWRIFLKH